MYTYVVLVYVLVCCSQPTRHNIRQQNKLNTINKHTAVVQVWLFVVVVIVGFKITLLLKVHVKRIHYKTAVFLVAPPTLEITRG